MEETDLLKEITYLTRLIDKHKKVPDKTPSTNTSTKVAKERGHPVLPVQQFHVPKDKKMNCMIQTKNASNTTQMTKFTSPSLCKTAVSESKVIFINPARLKMPGVNKPLTSRRIVVPQNTVVNKNTSTRTVFINPNFKHMVGRGMSEKPFNALSSSKTSQSCVGLNNSVNSVNSNLNFKQSVGKKLDKSLEKSMSFECFKLENKLNKQTLINKSCTTKAMSCYINPHFKGILSHKDNQCKQDSFKQNKNLKEEAKQTQAPQRIVMLGTGTTSTESFFKSRTNLPLSAVLQTPQKDHDSISKPFLNQEFSDKAVPKLQQLRKNKQLKNDLNLSKIIINSSPSQPKGKVMCINVSTKAENNLVPKKYTSSQIDNESPGPRKIYVNKEKWKSNLAKINKTSGGPSIISDCLIKSESTKTNMKILNSARNIYVNRSLLAKQLKENQLRNSISAMNMKTTQDCILKLPDSSKRTMQQIKSNIIRQRKRSSSSTCLVSVSKTKLVRKNKSIVQVGSLKPNKRYAPENLNKLRKLEIATQFRYRPVKRAISRYHTQYINSNEISKLRKCSFVWSINNLVNINMHQQKTKLINPNKGIQSRFKYKVVSKGKIELKKSKYHINRIKDNKQSIVKNRQVIKKSLQQKPEERICKESRKLVRSNSSILMLSPTKLVRRKLPVMRSTPVPSHKLLPSVQMARLVKSKYKLNRSVFALKKNSFRYNRLENSGNSMQNSQLTNSRPYITKISSQKNRFPSLANIGGVFYKVTHNKLTRRSADSNKAVVSKGPILQVRGQRFRLDKTGRTLKSLGGNALTGVNKLRRVDIGGVTFIQSKQGTSLVRTNTHTARNRLIQAKQRSISLLTKKLRKNNQPCPLFHRFGRCTGKEKGTCSRTHNPKNIAICKKFVQGQCENTNCLLSHAIGPEKMPTCYHYLAGNCVRDNCPYLHVKVNSKAPVCLAFLQGYCGDGEKCKKRHKNVCPEFEDKGTCAKGKYCPYPHPKQNTIPKSKPVKRKKVEMKVPVVEISKEVSTFRYFDEEQHHEGLEVSVQETAVKDIQELIEIDESEEISESVGKRPKLGVLPAFIPLSMD